MSNVAKLSVGNPKTRDHITLPIDEFATMLATAEEMGARRALEEAEPDVRERWLFVLGQGHFIRARLWAAQIRGLLLQRA